MKEAKDVRTKSGQSVHLLRRIAEGLGLTPIELAEELGLPLWDVLGLWNGRGIVLAPIDQDPVWAKLSLHVDAKIGALMAVREELQRKLAADLQRRAAERKRVEDQ